MESLDLTKLIYIFVARLDDDPWLPGRVREHANLLRQEIRERHANADDWLPKSEETHARRRALAERFSIACKKGKDDFGCTFPDCRCPPI